jgi:hypothetical protein
MTLNDLVEQSHRLAKEKGWYEGGERNIPEALALIHSEVSEALEEYRRYGRDAVTYKQHNPAPRMPRKRALWHRHASNGAQPMKRYVPAPRDESTSLSASNTPTRIQPCPKHQRRYHGSSTTITHP